MTDTTEQSTGLNAIADAKYKTIPLSNALGWLKERLDQVVAGGIYLIAGQPGIGKSTLGIQIALDLGRQGHKTLFILTEQSKEDLAKRARLMCSDWPRKDAERALENIKPEEDLFDIEDINNFFVHHVLSSKAKYNGTKLIILDSVQGQGLSAGASKKYRQLYEFCRRCKTEGITVLLVAHVTKRGDISGPKDLEHNVDCVLVMRKAMSYRPLFVPKNRFGPAVFKPVPLEMNKKTTALQISPHSESLSSVAKTFLGGGIGLAEAQASVALPSYGSRGKITAPGLPKKEIEQLTTCISQIPDMEIEELDYTIHCRLPGEKRYRALLGLPVSMALISSYIQQEIPSYHIYIGEIDLQRKVREVPESIMIDLWEAIQSGTIPKPVRVFCPRSSANLIKDSVDGATIIGCDLLDDAVFQTWPQLKGK